MKPLLIFLFVNLGSHLCFADTKDCKHDDTTFKCVEVVSVYDGDTVTVNIPDVHPLIGKKIGVRIRGLDTPERKGKQPCEKDKAIEAKSLVETALKNAKQVDLLNCGKDKYFRLLCDVHHDGKNIADLILKQKLAYQYAGNTKQKIDWCTFGRSPAGEKK